MESFVESCSRADAYPRSLLKPGVPEYTLSALETQIDQRARKLFCNDRQACLWLLELSSRVADSCRIRTLKELQSHLQSNDPTARSRYISIEAPFARERLNVTRRMFSYLLTYFQVTPAFLEFVLPFGRTDYAPDFPYKGFQNTSRIGCGDSVCQSAYQRLELCYSLGSVEPYRDPQKPEETLWSIRLCSVYHSFDLKTGRTNWVTVKGNDVIRKMVESHMATERGPSLDDDANTSFCESLQVHLLLGQWAAQFWHSYISHLQEVLQKTSRRATTITVDSSKHSESLTNYINNLRGQRESRNPPPSKSGISKNVGRLWSTIRPTHHNAQNPNLPIEMVEEPERIVEGADIPFTIMDLQNLQTVHEKASSAMLALKANTDVLNQIRQTYAALQLGSETYTNTASEPQNHIRRFISSMDGIMAQLDMQKSKVETLLALLNERKTLIYGIVQYESMETTRLMAEKAQVSTYHMEMMTQEMSAIARKTNTETVSMRIITLVTLFFLPGTFISTLMSTPIVSFEQWNKSFSSQNIGLGALQFYITLSLPLMFLTFCGWYVVYRLEKQREKQMNERLLEEGKLSF